MHSCRVVRFSLVSLLVIFSLILVPGHIFAADSIGETTLAVQAEIVPKKSVQVGDRVFVGSEYVIGAEGTLTILFVDESVLTLLPGSRAVIEEFSMGSKGKKGKCVIKVLSGQYRWVPGKIMADGGLQYVATAHGANSGSNSQGAAHQSGKDGKVSGNGQAGGPLAVGGQKGVAADNSPGEPPGNRPNNLGGPDGLSPSGSDDSPDIVGSTEGTGDSGTGGMGAGVPIINTGAFSGGSGGGSGFKPPTIPPGSIGGGSGGGNWIPADNLMSLQNGMMSMNPAAAAAADIASMMNPAASSAFGKGISGIDSGLDIDAAAPRMGMGAMGGMTGPDSVPGGLAAPTIDLGRSASPGFGPGGIAAPIAGIDGIAAPKVEMGSIAAPKVEMGSIAAPKVEMGSVAAPRIEIGTLAAPKVEVGTVAAPKVEMGTVAAPMVEMGIESIGAPMMK